MFIPSSVLLFDSLNAKQTFSRFGSSLERRMSEKHFECSGDRTSWTEWPSQLVESAVKTRMIEMIEDQMWNKISNNFLANMTYSAMTGNDESWLKWSRYSFHRICWNFHCFCKGQRLLKANGFSSETWEYGLTMFSHHSGERISMILCCFLSFVQEVCCCVLFLRMFPDLCWRTSYCFQACSHLPHTRWWWRCLTRQQLENLPVRQKWSWIFCRDLTWKWSNLTKQHGGPYTCVSGHVNLLIIQESRDVNTLWTLESWWAALFCLFPNNDSGRRKSEKFTGCVHMWPVKLLLFDHFGRLPSFRKISFIERQRDILFMTILWNLQWSL